MNLFDLKNNPLFLQGFRERNRFSAVVSAITLVAIIVIILFISAFLNDNYIYQYVPDGASYKTNKILLPWYKKTLLDLCVMQGIVILLFGCINAFKMASRERMSGTIDFHRSSPTPRKNQIIGLVFGSTSLEWWVFAVIFIIELALSLIMKISLPAVLQFNVQILFCALLYHSLFSLIGISRHPLKNKAGAFFIFIGAYFFVHLLIANRLSFLNQLSWVNAYQQLDVQIKGVEYGNHWGYYQRHTRDLINMFFGVKLHPLFFQLLVQIPFISLFFDGIGRRFQNLEQPIFSKSQTLLATFYILFLYCGSYTSILLSGSGHFRHYGSASIGTLTFIIILFGIIGSVLATPTQLSYLRGLRRIKKQGLTRISAGDNCSSNVGWLMVYGFIIAIILSYFFYLFKIPVLKAVATTIILFSYVAFFACYLEYFQLSRHHSKRAIAWTILVVIWVLIPLFGVIMKSVIDQSSYIYLALMAPSPFFGALEPIVRLFKPYSSSITNVQLWITLVVPTSMAVIAALMAYSQRKRLQDKYLKG